MSRTQPQQRLSAEQRTAQIRALLGQYNEQTLAQLAPAMGCSQSLVIYYARKMIDVQVSRVLAASASGVRKKIVLSLVEGDEP